MGYFSLLQIVYLVIIPGFIYTLAYSYLQAILDRPLNSQIFIPDGLLVMFFLLSGLFTYGGIAIHAVTKMLSEHLPHDGSKGYLMNRYFHLTFSHNLVYSGAIFTALCLTLLELNHIALQDPVNLAWSIGKGGIMGASLILGLFWYNPYGRISRWSDLKTFFLFFWISFMLVVLGVIKLDPSLRSYDLLLPVLFSFSLIGLLSTVLVLRKLKNGRLGFFLNVGKEEKELFEIEEKQFSSNKQSSSHGD